MNLETKQTRKEDNYMLNALLPKAYYSSIYEIDFKKLYSNGYRGVMFDIDNTLVPFDRALPDQKVKTLFDSLQKMGFKISLISNNSHDRVLKFNESLKVHAFPRARKPRTVNLQKAIALMNTTPKTTVIIGDQLFTDVWAGNQVGAKSILVVPIQEKEQIITKIKRRTERMILNYFLKRGLKNDLS